MDWQKIATNVNKEINDKIYQEKQNKIDNDKRYLDKINEWYRIQLLKDKDRIVSI